MDSLFNIIGIMFLIACGIGIVFLTVAMIWIFVRLVINEFKELKSWEIYYDDRYRKRVKQLKDEMQKEYEEKLRQKSKEYFQEFYDNERKLKKEQEDMDGDKV